MAYFAVQIFPVNFLSTTQIGGRKVELGKDGQDKNLKSITCMFQNIGQQLFRCLLVASATLLAAQLISLLFIPKLALALEGGPRAAILLCGIVLLAASAGMSLLHSNKRLAYFGFIVSVLAILAGSIPGFMRL
ncbi:MAG TPA: hypothetical protein VGH42_10825 [Verrucomicrobiae bacterium]